MGFNNSAITAMFDSSEDDSEAYMFPIRIGLVDGDQSQSSDSTVQSHKNKGSGNLSSLPKFDIFRFLQPRAPDEAFDPALMFTLLLTARHAFCT